MHSEPLKARHATNFAKKLGLRSLAGQLAAEYCASSFIGFEKKFPSPYGVMEFERYLTLLAISKNGQSFRPLAG